MLESLFGEHYSVHSFVFSPIDLGIPSSRPRRHLREQSKPQGPLTHCRLLVSVESTPEANEAMPTAIPSQVCVTYVWNPFSQHRNQAS